MGTLQFYKWKIVQEFLHGCEDVGSIEKVTISEKQKKKGNIWGKFFF